MARGEKQALEGPDEFRRLLRGLRLTRREIKSKLRDGKARRKPLTVSERTAILGKTDGRCHICGGAISGEWQADHVLPHSGGGRHSAANYLPAHSLCNNYRWDYSAEEFQLILKLGVWIRMQIERATPLGRQAATQFLGHEARREGRRRHPGG